MSEVASLPDEEDPSPAALLATRPHLSLDPIDGLTMEEVPLAAIIAELGTLLAGNDVRAASLWRERGSQLEEVAGPAAGQITQVDLTDSAAGGSGQVKTVAREIAYHPFGGVKRQGERPLQACQLSQRRTLRSHQMLNDKHRKALAQPAHAVMGRRITADVGLGQ